MNILELQPDDAIVVTLVEQLSKEQRDDLVAQVRRDFGMRRVVVLDSGSQITVVRHMTIVSRVPEGEVPLDALSPEQIDKIQCEERKALHEYMQVNRENRHPLAQREVQHVDTDDQDEEPAGVLPPHVWLYRNMLTDLQALAPLGVDTTNGQVAVAVDDLSDEQRKIPHVKEQLDRQSEERLLDLMQKNNMQSDAG